MEISESYGLIQSGRKISQQDIKDIRETVELFPNLSRMELAQTICENMGWYTAAGSNKTDACMRLLEKLESRGCFQLPQKKIRKKINKKATLVWTEKTEPGQKITGSFHILEKVTIEVVKDKKTKELWEEYMSRYHYLGTTRPFGFFLRYFIKSNEKLLGCALFAGASKAIGTRDKWIGWTANQRLTNLSWVINNTRFLIFPWINVKNLASHSLGQFGRHICHDWHEKWGYSPVLLETFVDDNFYNGTCYKAANWKYLGMTTGKGLVRKNKKYTTTPKKIFVMPLVKNFREKLCSDKLMETNNS